MLLATANPSVNADAAPADVEVLVAVAVWSTMTIVTTPALPVVLSTVAGCSTVADAVPALVEVLSTVAWMLAVVGEPSSAIRPGRITSDHQSRKQNGSALNICISPAVSTRFQIAPMFAVEFAVLGTGGCTKHAMPDVAV